MAKKPDDYRREHDEMVEKLKDVVYCPECGGSFKITEQKERICPHCKKVKWTEKGFVTIEKVKENVKLPFED